jgi:hypothetical protein
VRYFPPRVSGARSIVVDMRTPKKLERSGNADSVRCLLPAHS